MKIAELLFFQISLFANENGTAWKQIASVDDIVVYQNDETDHAVPAFKGESLIHAPLINVASVIEDTTRAKEWMDDLVEIKVLDQKSEFDRVVYSRFASPIPFLANDRDFVQHLTIEMDPNAKRILFLGRSIVDPRCPETDTPVRAENILTEFILEPRSSGKETWLVVDAQIDPKGAIPKWIAANVQKNWPIDTIRNIRKQAMKPDIVIPLFIRKLAEFRKP